MVKDNGVHMAYIKFLAAWKNQDICDLKKMLSQDIEVRISYSDKQIVLDYPRTVKLLEKRFEIQQDWHFDIIQQYTREDENIIVTNITREDSNARLLEPLFLSIFTFKGDSNNSQLIRLHIEAELNPI
ncbi:hypothetical protein [Macrococcus brunensis]|uniref:hypothetical protein n=1 Tax=Macrococcus brunensis TaxID=198483 RepID=UPI001EF152E5|nr:hypothetical protein [Macrococcus brunensis]ULG71627.1 hypothetical protein MGG12_10030 [Macrococcus brunensis]ULG73890.1 hypothetical protein MGG13_09550 [Macrococcus brunensis]